MDPTQDAQAQYDLAMAAYNAAQKQLADAGVAVETQDRLSDFSAVVTGLEKKPPDTFPALSADEVTTLADLKERKYTNHETLSAADEQTLAALNLRDVANRYSDLISTRAEYIKQTERTVRIEKAKQLIQNEIKVRQQAVIEKERKFQTTLNRDMPVDVTGLDDAQKKRVLDARMGVYQQILAVSDAQGQWGLFNLYRSWYWQSGAWSGQYLNEWSGVNGQKGALAPPPQVTPGMVLEAEYGLIGSALMPAQDRADVALFLSRGSVGDFSNFTGTYWSFLNATQLRDMKQQELAIAFAAAGPLFSLGNTLIAHGKALMNTIILYFTGLINVAMGQALMLLGGNKITAATMQLSWAQIAYGVAGFNAMSTSTDNDAREIQRAQNEYQAAQANLDYFTKVPDMQTLKERLVQWGKQHSDPDGTGGNLYDLTDADLAYLTDAKGFVTETGALDPDATADVQAHKLDASSSMHATTAKDPFGRAYDPDPAQMKTSPPGALVSGAYVDGGQKWTKVQITLNDGSQAVRYARIVDPSSATQSYDIGEILGMLADHGERLRSDAKTAYINAGNAHNDATFVMNERDSTTDKELKYAAGQGRQYAGYTMTWNDYQSNADGIFASQLQEQRAVQEQDWQIRADELAYARSQWEDKMRTIMARGQAAWSAQDDKLLAEQRKWEREYDKKTENGKKDWDQKIKDFMTEKRNWENDVRSKSNEQTIVTVLTDAANKMVSQIGAMSANLGIKIEAASVQDQINQAVAELRAKDPGRTDTLALINKDIGNFNTMLAMSDMHSVNVGSGLNLGTGSLALQFSDEMRKHEREMVVMGNAKALEAYQNMFDDLADQIDAQNKAISNQTSTAALSAGFTRQGNQFVKIGHTAGATAFVDAYIWYDAKAGLNRAMSEAGFSNKTGSDLTKFLENASDVEVQSYFKTAALEAQVVLTKVAGTGDQDQRRTASKDDAKLLGYFGQWAGRGPTQDQINFWKSFAGNSYAGSAGSTAIRDQALGALVGGGFGELGAVGMRHEGSGLNGGFYVQLGLASDYVGRLDAKDMQMATLSNPLQAVTDAQNPMSMYYNVKMGHDIHGKGSGYMTEANLLSSGSAGLKAGGGVMVAAGSKFCFTGAGCLVAGAGAVAMLAGQAIHADPVTGKRGFGMSERDWTEAGVMIGAAAAGGYYFGGGATAAGSQFSWGQAALAGGAGAFNTGIQSDAQGHVYGYNLDGARGDSALVAFGVGFAGSAAGQGLAGNGIGGAPGSFGSSYASASASALITNSVYYERYLANGDQTYLGMQNGNPGAFWGGIAGGMAGAAAVSAIAAAQAENFIKNSTGNSDFARLSPEQKQAVWNALPPEIQSAVRAQQAQMWAEANKAAENGNKEQAASILRALGRREDEIQQFVTGGTSSVHRATTVLNELLRMSGLMDNKGAAKSWDDLSTELRDASGAKDNYGDIDMRKVLALASQKGVDLSKVDWTELGNRVGGQVQFSRMMDQVRAMQEYQSGSSGWDNSSYGLSDHYGMMFDKFSNLGIGGSLKWMANSVLNRTADHDAAARSFATALGNDLGISDSVKFADAAQKYAETMTGIKTGDKSGAMMAIGAVLMGRFRLAGSAAGALGAELPGLMRLGGQAMGRLFAAYGTQAALGSVPFAMLGAYSGAEKYFGFGAGAPTTPLGGDFKPAQLTDAHIALIEAKAKEWQVDSKLLRAVISVESGGMAFGRDGKLLIRFEPQWFNAFTGNKYSNHFFFPTTADGKVDWSTEGLNGQGFRADVDEGFQLYHHKGQSGEWKAFDWAVGQDSDAAMKSISMGFGQIMGFNHTATGFASAQEMFESFGASRDNQINGLVKFLPSYNGGALIKALQQNNEAGLRAFVTGYNGSSQVNKYMGWIQGAYKGIK